MNDTLVEQLHAKNIILQSGKINPKASTIINKNPDLKTAIINATSFISTGDAYRERIHCVLSNITKIPKCKTRTCSNTVPFILTGNKSANQYAEYCSVSCSYKDPDRNQKILKTKTKKYPRGVLAQLAVKAKMDKYGCMTPDSAVKKAKLTKQKRYNNENYNNTKKIKNTCTEKYGVTNYGYVKYKEILDQILDADFLIDQHITYKKSFAQISAEHNGIDYNSLLNHIRRKYPDFIPTTYSRSHGEKQLCEWLTSNNITHRYSDRKLIAPLELDIYIPEHKLAIEYCGLYWHSEQAGKGRHYHANKHKLCTDQGIRLLTIYEDEWVNRQEQAKMKILSLLNLDPRPKLYARKCKVVLVETHIKQKFFDDNHLQGNGPGSINIGLTNNDELVACMSFIKQQNNTFTLNRYATSHRVVGGFSKLLTHFKSNYEWNKILSFADLRWSDGNLYKTTGWKLDKVIPPDYYYSPDGHMRYHKFNYRRKNLPKLLKEFDPSLSETENCNRNGILRIWDCGKQRWVINKSS